MARPIKNNCDYFSHDNDMRNHKKIKAIRSKFGLNGYAVWVMILEYLTGNDGNEFEYSEFEFELMSGDFGCSGDEVKNIVDYCIKLELLFSINGFVKSESLDERLASVYEKRKVSKDISARQRRANGKFVTEIPVVTVVSATEMPQSKVKEIKEKESKVKESKQTLHLFRESIYYDFEKFKISFAGSDYEFFNLKYYYEAVLNWSDSGNNKKIDWVATARGFMQRDAKDGKAALEGQNLINNGKSGQKQDINAATKERLFNKYGGGTGNGTQ